MKNPCGFRQIISLAGVTLAMAAGIALAQDPPPALAAGAGTNQTAVPPPLPQVGVMGAFRPLARDIRAQVVDALKSLPAKYGTNCPPIEVNVAAGNNRPILSHEMISMLKQAGLDARQGDAQLITPMPASSAPDILIKCDDHDAPFASDLAQAFAGLLPRKISIVSAPESASGHVGFFIYGNPVFSATGSVTFR